MTTSNFSSVPGIQFTDAAFAPYPDAWVGMADTIDGATKWLRLGGILDAGARRLALDGDRVQVTGRLGIGTTAPAARLSVVAPGATEVAGSAASATLRTSAGSLGAAAGAELALASVGFQSGNNTSLGIRAYRTAAGTDWTTAAVGLGVDVDNTVRVNGSGLWLHANGSVGIGTPTPPRQKLHVNGGAIVGGIVLGGDVPGVVDYPSEYETVGVANATMNLRLQSPNAIVFHTAGTPRLSIDNAGNANLGTPGAFVTLTVGAGANGGLRVRHIDGKHWQTDANDGLFLNWNTGQPVVVGNPQTTSGLIVYGDVTIDKSPADDATSSLSRLSLTNRGPGGQGVTWSLYTAAVGGGWGVAPNAFEIWEYPATAMRFQIRPGGDIDTGYHFQSSFRCADFLIGTVGRRGSPGRALVDGGNAAFGNRLYINYGRDWPNVRVEGNFSQGSSREHKENITDLPVEKAVAVLRHLKAVEFTWKDDPDGRACPGFVAEEVPDGVGSADKKGVNPLGMLAVLVKTVQEQLTTTQAIAERLERLERAQQAGAVAHHWSA